MLSTTCATGDHAWASYWAAETAAYYVPPRHSCQLGFSVDYLFFAAKAVAVVAVLDADADRASGWDVCLDAAPQLAEVWQRSRPHPDDEMLVVLDGSCDRVVPLKLKQTAAPRKNIMLCERVERAAQMGQKPTHL